MYIASFCDSVPWVQGMSCGDIFIALKVCFRANSEKVNPHGMCNLWEAYSHTAAVNALGECLQVYEIR